MSKHAVLTVLALAGSAVAVSAQDSTATSAGLPGDALNPLAAGDQITSYVADLAPFDTSWGTVFGIVPVVKSPKGNASFFNNLLSANGISDDLRRGVPFASPMYSLWEDMPGVGVNAQQNAAPMMIPAPGASSSQFAVGLSSFATTANNLSGDFITSAIVNYEPANPNRLYVTRIETASTVDAGDTVDSGSLAFGSIDADGNAYMRGDDFGSAAADAMMGDNTFRVRSQDRSGLVNRISVAGGADATDTLLFNAASLHPAPSNIPASAAGGNGLSAGPNFSSQYVRGAAAPLTADSSHFNPVVGLGYTPADHRGSMGTTTRLLLDSGVATSAVLAKDAIDATRTYAVWSTDASGNVVEGYGFETPFSVTDPIEGKVVNYSPISEYNQYRGIQTFRGGGGLVALGEDAEGRGYASGTISEFGLSFDLFMQNVVVRFNEDGSNPEWTILSWVDNNGPTGKQILDGPGGNVIGTLIPFRTAFPNANPVFGPSMSTPTFDGNGNAWFVASAALDKIDPDTMEPFIDYDTVLIRGVRTELPGQSPSFGYELELVMELGNVFFGQNSGTPYQVQFIDLTANSNGNGVASPSGIDHNNGRSWGWDNTDLTGVDAADPINTGGVVLSAEIVYDADGDGDFEDPTGTNGNPDSGDQAYQTLLYIGYYAEGPTPCNAADLAEPFGVLDLSDIVAFIDGFNGLDPIADSTTTASSI
jgi:hypothetical protein